MALGGGTFTAQNKILPGAYINFVSLARASSALSDRGVAAMPLELDWGPEGAVFAVETAQFQKDSMKLFGYPYTHEKLKGLRDLFRNIRKGFFFRMGTGGAAASNDYATANFPGVRGNALRIVITQNEGRSLVRTYLDENLVDSQTVAGAELLLPNDYVTFKEDAQLTETAGAPLTGGTNGAVTEAGWQTFLDKIEPYSFNTLGCVSTSDSVKELFAAFTKRMRDLCGVKFQTVLHRYPGANHEGIISVENNIAGSSGDDPAAIWWVTGAEAGCAANKSVTNRLYDGEYEINTDYTQSQLEAALQGGKFIFHNVGGDVRVLEDINTFVSFTEEKNEDFGANQTIRVLDQIANDIAALFARKYYGQVPNDASGRISLWNDIVRHHQELTALRALENFSPEDVAVDIGSTKKSVVVTDKVTPTNAMSQLYMTVLVA